MRRQAIGVWGLVLATAVAAFAAACGDSQHNGFSEYDPGGDDAGAEGGFVSDAAPAEAAPVVHDDFTKPILDTGVSPDAPQVFGQPDVSGALGPCLFEPELGSLFPKNWLRPRFRFTTAQNENLFEIKLEVANEKSPLYIYTTKSGYKLDKTAWSTITQYGIGTMHVTLRSAVVDAAGKLTAGPFKGAEGDIEIAPVEASGSVLYWTTSGGTVLKGFKIGDESVQSVITPAGANTHCVACHTSTPDGLYTGLTASPNDDGSSPGFVELVAVDGSGAAPPFLSASAKALLARTNQHAPSFSKAHWAPGDRIALTMLPVAGKSEIIWTDLEANSQAQGTGWNVLARSGDANAASSGTFSHDGTRIVYVSSASAGAGVIQDPDGALYTVDYNNRAGGNAAPITGANDPAYHHFYPTFYADDALVAYNRLTLATAQKKTSYNNPESEVFVIPTGGGTATRLAANDPPACLNVKSPGITNSWPKWSPEVKASGPSKYYFLVFSSTRNAATSGPQLYVAPIVVTGSEIKTYAALYLWNQPEAEHNHTPAWDVFQLPPPK